MWHLVERSSNMHMAIDHTPSAEQLLARRLGLQRLHNAEIWACLMCAFGRALTMSEADLVVTRTGELLEPYLCPAGNGWHLRVRKHVLD
jgi:hypothetical protein